MSKEKQIKEMASIAYPGLDHQTVFSSIVYAQPLVNLCNAGYRRKSEWISVDERLPEGKEPVLVTNGNQTVIAYRNWFYRTSTGELRIPANYGNGMTVTHWMPLPESPKGE